MIGEYPISRHIGVGRNPKSWPTTKAAIDEEGKETFLEDGHEGPIFFPVMASTPLDYHRFRRCRYRSSYLRNIHTTLIPARILP